MKQFNEKEIKRENSKGPLYETLQERLDKYPWDFTNFLSGYSTSLLPNCNDNTLISMVDTCLEFLKQNPDANPENVQGVLYLTNERVLPILNNRLFDNDLKCLTVKENIKNNYQSIFENLDELQELYQSQNLMEFSEECSVIASRLNSIGENILTVNSKHNHSLD